MKSLILPFVVCSLFVSSISYAGTANNQTLLDPIEDSSGGGTNPNNPNSGVTGTGAPGQVTFWTSATALSGDASLYWDNVNKMLGIGTSSPTSTLTVNGNGNISGVLIVGSIQSNGNITPTVDNTYTLGTSTARWASVYVGPGSYHLVSTAAQTGTARNYSISISTSGPSIGMLNIGEVNSGQTFLTMDPNSGAVTLNNTGGTNIGTVTTGVWNGNVILGMYIDSLQNLRGSLNLSQLNQTSATTGQVISWNGTTWAPAAAFTPPSGTANQVFATPNGTSGSASLRALTPTDIPSLPYTKITGLAPSAVIDTTNANNITSGTLASNQINGTYAGITGVGTLVSGSVPSSLVTGLAPSATTDTTNASNITSGVLPSGRLNGTYAGITGVGTLVSGSIPTSLLTGSLPLTQISTTGATNGQILTYTGGALTYASPATNGTVTSVAASVPSTLLTISGSPITSSGTLVFTLANAAQNTVFAGPATGGSGAPTYRILTSTDIPNLSYSKITGLAPSATIDTTNASNITSGTIASTLVTGTYAGITGVGTLVSGSIPNSLVTGLAPSATTDTTNASNISSGTLPSSRLSGSYAGITGVGTLASGSVPVTLLTGQIPLSQISTTGATSGQVLTYMGGTLVYANPAVSGTVTSVAATVPSSLLTVSGSPITSSGTLAFTLSNAAQNTVFAGPSTGPGTPSYRTLVSSDIPSLPFTQITGTVPTTQGGTGLTSFTAEGVFYANSMSSISQTVVNSTATPMYLAQTSGGAPTFQQIAFTDLSIPAQPANTGLFGPASGTSGTPSFRTLVANDIPATLNATAFPGLVVTGLTNAANANFSGNVAVNQNLIVTGQLSVTNGNFTNVNVSGMLTITGSFSTSAVVSNGNTLYLGVSGDPDAVAISQYVESGVFGETEYALMVPARIGTDPANFDSGVLAFGGIDANHLGLVGSSANPNGITGFTGGTLALRNGDNSFSGSTGFSADFFYSGHAGPFHANNGGSATSPVFQICNQLNANSNAFINCVGMHEPTVGVLGLDSNGVLAVTIDATQKATFVGNVAVNQNLTITGTVTAPTYAANTLGTASSPAYSINGNAGVFSKNQGNIALAANSTNFPTMLSLSSNLDPNGPNIVIGQSSADNAIGTGTANIVIGLNASTSNSNTINTAVVLGTNASVTNGQSCTAIGFGATAGTIGTGSGSATALGSNASATGSASTAVAGSASGVFSTAVGSHASATSSQTSAFGYTAVASASNATAIGEQTTCAFANSTAIGASATCTNSNQVVLGTASQIVVIPGAFSITGTFTTSDVVSNGNTLYMGVSGDPDAVAISQYVESGVYGETEYGLMVPARIGTDPANFNSGILAFGGIDANHMGLIGSAANPNGVTGFTGGTISLRNGDNSFTSASGFSSDFFYSGHAGPFHANNGGSATSPVFQICNQLNANSNAYINCSGMHAGGNFLYLDSNGTIAVTIDTNQKATFSGNVAMNQNLTVAGSLTITGAQTSATYTTTTNGSVTAPAFNINNVAGISVNTAGSMSLDVNTTSGMASMLYLSTNASTNGPTIVMGQSSADNSTSTQTRNIVIGLNASTSAAAIDHVIVIGNGAVAVSGAQSVAVGLNAAVGNGAVAIGANANATGTLGTSIGSSTYTGGNEATAIGYGASAPLSASTALGGNANAAGNYSLALGFQAYVPSGDSNSTAIGPGAVCTNSNQIMLGVANTNVVVPGNASVNGNYIYRFGGTMQESNTLYTNTIAGTAQGVVFSDGVIEIGIGANSVNLMPFGTGLAVTTPLGGYTNITCGGVVSHGIFSVSGSGVAIGSIYNLSPAGYGFGNVDANHTTIYSGSAPAVNFDSTQNANFTRNVTINGNLIVSGTTTGAVSYAISTQTGTYTVLSTDYTILVNAAAGAAVENLPAASSVPGHILNFKKIDSSTNTVTLQPNGTDTIDGSTNKIISSQYTSVTIQSNGSGWFIL